MEPTVKVWRVLIGARYFIFRLGNYGRRIIAPVVAHGPCGTFTASWQWGQIEGGLKKFPYWIRDDAAQGANARLTGALDNDITHYEDEDL